MKNRLARVGLFAVIGLFVLVQIYIALDSEVTRPTLPVKDGILDARGWDFDQDGMMRLDGTWTFYPNVLASPDSLPVDKAINIRVPGNWDKYAPEQRLFGIGTYEAVILLAPSAPPVIGIKVTNIRMSHRLYVNGRLLHENGRPSESQETEKPNNTPYTVYAPVENNRLHLVIQTANFHYYQGGIAQPIIIGEPDQVSRFALINFGIGLVSFMMTVSFGLYSLAVYLMRSRDRLYLYAGLFFLIVSLTVACADEKVLMVLLDWLPFTVAYKLQDLSLSGALILLLVFFRAVDPAFASKKVFRLMMAPILLYLTAVAILPYRTYIPVKMLFSPYQLVICGFSIVSWLLLLIKAQSRENRVERSLMFGTALFLTGSLLFQYLYLDQIIASKRLSFVSYFFFISTINLYLAVCSRNALRRSEQLTVQLLQANETKNEFLQRTSHELKTPLHGIRNLAEHLLRKETGMREDARRHLGVVVDTSERLSYIVNNLIDATQLRNMSFEVRFSSVDLSAVAEHALRIISMHVGPKPIALANRVPSRTFVEADEIRLQQIVYNVLSNAVKYSNEGTVAVTAKAQNGRVTLLIADEGIGMTESEQGSVFEDRYRADVAGQPPMDGMGLSLFVSRELARRMGGALYVASSEPGRGTEMALELKAARQLPEAYIHVTPDEREGGLTATAWPELAVSTDAGERERRSVLLVDDDPMNLEVLRLILQDDYDLEVAYGGEEALARLNNRRFDLMITDYLMPGMSGLELTKRVRANHSSVSLPVIIATAASREADVELAYQAGATDYIAKPFSAGEIRKRVQLLLQLSGTMEAALRNERAFLAAQIKPHFLYNALNNIIAACYDEPERAAEWLRLLSRHLRRMFRYESTTHTIPLEQELELIRDYVELERLRFGDRLRFEIEIDPPLLAENPQVRTLLIQPLVENAICHGIFNKIGAGTVTLRIRHEEECLRIDVEDDGIGIGPDAVRRMIAGETLKGVGLSNVRRQVAAVEGADFRLQSVEGGGTRCTILLPARFQKEVKQWPTLR
ncbi:response regulator [Cohnella endophytica]|uniref:histidine kinase n=1 Tax=Cohnella endophytica TaxID=2419778 RepID=A0A494X6G2_9BACL|nr:ATP-binding protein [Cohnella endophytica]RKP46285.1 response regulator [Cohnella endophytica]